MANYELPSNITPEAMEAEWAKNNNQQPEGKTSTFNEKNYLNVRLAKDEAKKELKIRILPISSTESTPFVHVFFHNVEVPKEMVPQGAKPYKSFICLNHKKNPMVGDGTVKCPFCEANWEYYQEYQNATTKEEKDSLAKVSASYRAKEAVIVRCIERGKENEGPKFWKINLWDDKSDPYNKIMNIYRQRNQESIDATGNGKNIFDLNLGRDFTLTITQGNTENQVKIDVMDAGIDTPLSKDYNEAMSWITDAKEWTDVFTVKPYEYLKLIREGKYPWYSKDKGTWVAKEDYESNKSNQVQEQNTQINQAEAKYTAPQQPQVAQPQVPVQPVMPAVQTPVNDDDDLPF